MYLQPSLRAFLMLVLVMVSVEGSAQDKQELAVLRATQEFLQAFNRFEWEKFRLSFTDDATMFHPVWEQGRRRVGRQEVEATWLEVFPEFKDTANFRQMQIEPRDLRVQVYGKSAVVSFHLGEGRQHLARRTLVWVKQKGRWKIAHLHASFVQAPAEPVNGASGTTAVKVYTSDIDHFWEAYDSIRTTRDSLQQLRYIRELYINKGTEGLKAFMQLRDYSDVYWVKLINRLPKFWNSIRPNTLSVKGKAAEIERSIQRLKVLYPGLREAKMYFTVGGLRSGGTTMNDMVLVGTEIATGTASTDVSEFPDPWLAGVFREQRLDNIVPLNIHEYVHTQQKQVAIQNLLGACIRQGACDFIAELVMGEPLGNNYLRYGRQQDAVLKEKFRNDMYTTDYRDWLYNGANAGTMADLGYYMGYAICESYYRNAADKALAVKEIIELDHSDADAVRAFLNRSGYYGKPH